MKKRSDHVRFEVVQIPAPEGSLDDLLDFVADLLVKKWMKEKQAMDAKGNEIDDSNKRMRSNNAPGKELFHV